MPTARKAGRRALRQALRAGAEDTSAKDTFQGARDEGLSRVQALRAVGRTQGAGAQADTLRADRGNARKLGLGLGLSRSQRGTLRNAGREGNAQAGFDVISSLNKRKQGRLQRLSQRQGRRGQVASQLLGGTGLDRLTALKPENEF